MHNPSNNEGSVLNTTDASYPLFNVTEEPLMDYNELNESATIIDNITEKNFFNVTAEEISHKKDQDYYIAIYASLIIGSIILLTTRSLLFYKFCMIASRTLHNTMFHNVLQAVMRFFDTNPSGK